MTATLSQLMNFPSGTLVGPYRLDRLLSASSFGITYRATRDGRPFALKIPLSNLTTPVHQERRATERGIRRELAALMSLHHLAVASVEGFGHWPDPDTGLLYVAM